MKVYMYDNKRDTCATKFTATTYIVKLERVKIASMENGSTNELNKFKTIWNKDKKLKCLGGDMYQGYQHYIFYVFIHAVPSTTVL